MWHITNKIWNEGRHVISADKICIGAVEIIQVKTNFSQVLTCGARESSQY